MTWQSVVIIVASIFGVVTITGIVAFVIQWKSISKNFDRF